MKALLLTFFILITAYSITGCINNEPHRDPLPLRHSEYRIQTLISDHFGNKFNQIHSGQYYGDYRYVALVAVNTENQFAHQYYRLALIRNSLESNWQIIDVFPCDTTGQTLD